jgi:photosystem II stability/assembly factor-like uncharacterized protein
VDVQLYVATGGMSTWYSNDCGQTFERHWSPSGLYSESRVWALSSHPDVPGEVLAGTDSGVYRLDRATNKWDHLPSVLDKVHIWCFARDSKNPDLMLAGTYPAEVYRSEDRGKTWTALRAGFAESCPAVVIPRVTQILIDPHDSNAIWATVEIDGIWRSLDGGKTWAKHVTGAISEDGHGVALVRKNGKRVLFLTTNMGLDVSHDEGETWEFRPLAKPWQYQRGIAPRADDSGVMFLTIGDSVPGSTGSLMRSRDFGETWEDAGLAGETKSTPWCIAINPADPNLIFVSTIFGKFFRSTDGGETWTKLPRELGETRSLLWLPT